MAEPGSEVGDLAIVLHSHMPYVEGFGTYPFGEEWLFDAILRSYLPVLDVARDITVTITPVLADQLEADGVAERLRRFLHDFRIGPAQADLDSCEAEYRPAAEAELARYQAAARSLDRLGGDLLAPFREAFDSGRIALAASSATHAILPLLATRKGLDMQIATGIDSHRRRFGFSGGFWLPECAYRPGLEWDLARHGVEWFCTDQSDFEADGQALSPVLTDSGLTAFTIDWPTIARVWDMKGYPSWRGYLDFHRLSMNGMRIFAIDGGRCDPAAAAAMARQQADDFLATVKSRLADFREQSGRAGTLVFAVDCELLGHWWSEGPIWLERVIAGAGGAGIGLRRLDRPGRADPARRDAELGASTWGEKKDFRTWDSPAVADLAWGVRQLELRIMQEIGEGLGRDRAERALRELMGVQASDWAFLDGRREAGDYGWERVLGHAESAYEAIDCANDLPVNPRMRSLAPDLRIAPLYEP